MGMGGSFLRHALPLSKMLKGLEKERGIES